MLKYEIFLAEIIYWITCTLPNIFLGKMFMCLVSRRQYVVVVIVITVNNKIIKIVNANCIGI